MKRIGYALGTLLIAIPLVSLAEPLGQGELVKLDTRPGVTQGIFITTPRQTPPKAVMVLYSGGEGRLHLEADGPSKSRDNFVIRTASYWIDHGYAVVQVDVPSDHWRDGLSAYTRRTPDILADQKVVSAEIRKRFPGVKVVLYGTSNGTATEGNILMGAPELADLYVLTSPVSIARKYIGIADLDVPQAYRDRTMLMSNENDGCPAARYSGAQRLVSKNGLTLITESSTEDGGEECGPESPHGYLGIEAKALADSDAWIASKLN
ncbi:MAG: hypothetical protein EPN59_09480 [Paraburkholderia sp.]|nr:hypothetical protein [Paraburkholderia sp.]TAM30381.1 MAG: hypothetical protein EPN59_09480 [Paraburkholderia sp.]